MAALYDKIGQTYAGTRQSDPRVGAAIERALTGCNSILNVGAGTGSYEPRSRMVVAVEPSSIMIAQRPAGAAPVVQACAEALPFPKGSFDAVLGILTVHHWKDQAKGFAECARVARSRVLFLTNDFDVAPSSGFSTTFRNCYAPIETSFQVSRAFRMPSGRSKRLPFPSLKIVAMVFSEPIGNGRVPTWIGPFATAFPLSPKSAMSIHSLRICRTTSCRESGSSGTPACRVSAHSTWATA